MLLGEEIEPLEDDAYRDDRQEQQGVHRGAAAIEKVDELLEETHWFYPLNEIGVRTTLCADASSVNKEGGLDSPVRVANPVRRKSFRFLPRDALGQTS